MGDFSCNKFVIYAIFCTVQHNKSKKGAYMIVFHLIMSQVTRPEQKNWQKNDEFEKIEACLYQRR